MSINVALSSEFEQFVRHQVDSGRYENATEVIKAGLRLLEDQETLQTKQLEELRHAIAAGIASGPDTSADEVLNRLEEKYRRLSDRSL